MAAGLVDTAVLIDWANAAVINALPDEVAVSAISMAELAAGPHLARDPAERARRQANLQQAEALFEPLDFDRVAARSYGQIVAAATAAGRSHRGRIADLLIAAVAHANGLTLYTRNPADFAGLSTLITVVGV
ncbi:MAG TPA: type II toxin-antitoxin system VapC family toxin [Chloroflexota bacterium]